MLLKRSTLFIIAREMVLMLTTTTVIEPLCHGVDNGPVKGTVSILFLAKYFLIVFMFGAVLYG